MSSSVGNSSNNNPNITWDQFKEKYPDSKERVQKLSQVQIDNAKIWENKVTDDAKSKFNAKDDSKINELKAKITKSKGFFWDKIVRGIFGYKFDILRERRNVEAKDLNAFYAAVTIVKFNSNSHQSIGKTLKVSKKRFQNHPKKLDFIKNELKKEGDYDVRQLRCT